jgi:hypothetical protein
MSTADEHRDGVQEPAAPQTTEVRMAYEAIGTRSRNVTSNLTIGLRQLSPTFMS